MAGIEEKHDVTVFYTGRSVMEAALERIEYLFNEFDEVIVSFSGGKDSTVVFNLALQVAKKLNRLPLKVMFIDQEAEWQCAIDYIREVMTMPEVEPAWYQAPMRIFNAASLTDDWLWCWEEGKEDVWMRPKESFSITKFEDIPADTAFNDLFTVITNKRFGTGVSVACLGGLRAEENPKRRAGLTTGLTYKHITWGKKLRHSRYPHYTFYPLYDWSYRDIWKAIYDGGWTYCKLYDYQFRDGIPIPAMRVSNLHHETALNSLTYLHKVERQTWNALVKRLGGINTFKNIRAGYNVPDELPYMFSDWYEYRDYLLKYLTSDDKKDIFTHRFGLDQEKIVKWELVGTPNEKAIVRSQIQAILINDYYFTTLDNFFNRLRMDLRYATDKK